MKKSLRVTAFICLLLVTAMSLSSCYYLDQLKSQRAVLDETSNRVEYEGKTYVYVDNPGRYQINSDDWLTCWYVDEDIPLLLTSREGSYGRYYRDLDVFYNFAGIYCTEDRVEYFENAMKKGPVGFYKLDNTYYDEEKDCDVRVMHVLDATETVIIDSLHGKLNNFETDDLSGMLVFGLDACDENAILENEYVQGLFWNPDTDVCGAIRGAIDYKGVMKGRLFEGKDKEIILKMLKEHYPKESWRYAETLIETYTYY